MDLHGWEYMGKGMKPLVKEKGVGCPFLEGVARIFFVNFQKYWKEIVGSQVYRLHPPYNNL
jgi:hypothetical protein